MLFIRKYNEGQPMPQPDWETTIDFLATHLQQFGDPPEQIAAAMRYALSMDDSPGGFVLTAHYEDDLVGAVVLNRTGMAGYIPENILVYIAVHQKARGRGWGKQLMQAAIREAQGGIALHVEPDNPAVGLYKSLGFTHKYLEMRHPGHAER